MREEVILVDEFDQCIGVEEKRKAHEQGKLHRAFSIFVFNAEGALLLQKRAAGKYHSGGLWSNTCCSHPRPEEIMEDAIHRRLLEEMGFDCQLHKIFEFTYKAKLDKGLVEHEIDHVFLGRYQGQPSINPDEVSDYRWIDLEALGKRMEAEPSSYSYWLRHSFDSLMSYLLQHPLESRGAEPPVPIV